MKIRELKTWRLAGALAALLAAAASGTALASGVGIAEDAFVSRGGTDIELDQFEAGQLGVVLPTYWRASLYTTWRATVMGRTGLAAAPAKTGGLREILGNAAPKGWQEAGSGDAPDAVKQWTLASAPYAAPNRKSPSQGMRGATTEYSSYMICPSGAFLFAAQTLDRLVKRQDATPERLRTWVAGQDAVMSFCGKEKVTKIEWNGKPGQVPAPLPESESSFFWRQLREYQIAAAAFYNEDFAESERRFSAIGANPRDPMYAWGAYLALRSKARMADLDRWPGQASAAADAKVKQLEPIKQSDAAKYEAAESAIKAALERGIQERRSAQVADLSARAASILADPALSEVHNPARATLRTMQARLVPEARFDELGTLLEDVARDPHAEDHLMDWQLLADGQLPDASLKPSAYPKRQAHPFLDWILTLRDCGDAKAQVASGSPNQDTQAKAHALCRQQFEHALVQWKAGPVAAASPGPNPSRAWMLAALMVGENLPPELEQAALAVSDDAPEYLTVRYNLARIYRLQNRAGAARAIADAELASPRLRQLGSASAQNLFLQERFAVAASTHEAAGLLLREPSFMRGGTEEAAVRYNPAAHARRLAADGARWLNGQLGSAELLEIARDERLDAPIRGSIAISAWLRADLLGQRQLADQAATLAARLNPKLKPATDGYLRLAAPQVRRHALVLAMLRYDLQPFVVSDWPSELSESPVGTEDVTASMWCKMTEDIDSYAGFSSGGAEQQLPPVLKLSADSAVRDREVQALARMKTATGFVGDHVLGWARTHPRDPDLAVAALRGRLVDARRLPGQGCFQTVAHRILVAAWPLQGWRVGGEDAVLVLRAGELRPAKSICKAVVQFHLHQPAKRDEGLLAVEIAVVQIETGQHLPYRRIERLAGGAAQIEQQGGAMRCALGAIATCPQQRLFHILARMAGADAQQALHPVRRTIQQADLARQESVDIGHAALPVHRLGRGDAGVDGQMMLQGGVDSLASGGAVDRRQRLHLPPGDVAVGEQLHQLLMLLGRHCRDRRQVIGFALGPLPPNRRHAGLEPLQGGCLGRCGTGTGSPFAPARDRDAETAITSMMPASRSITQAAPGACWRANSAPTNS